MVIHQIWPQKNWKLHSVWFWCISDMVLYLLRWEKQGASLNFVPTHLFGKIQDFFVPGTYWQFLLKSHAKAWISFARPWKSHYNLQIKHTNWKNAFAFKFSIRFDFFLAEKWIGNIFLNFVNLRWNFFSQHVPSSLCLPSSSSRHIFHSTTTWSQLFQEESNQKLLFHFQMHW